jgi:hypothetical protein
MLTANATLVLRLNFSVEKIFKTKAIAQLGFNL